MRKRKPSQIKESKYLKMSELAELNKTRYSTVKFYSQLGLLPYEQRGQRLAKYYPTRKASEALQRILKLRSKGKTVPEIVKIINGKSNEV